MRTADVVAVHTDAEGHEWVQTTDRYGYVTRETTPLQHTVEIDRDGFGLRTGTNDDGAAIGLFPDWLGRRVKRENADGTYDFWTYNANSRPGQPASHTDAKGRTTLYTWSNDRLMSVENHLGHVTSYTYTAEGLLESVTLPDPDGAGPRQPPTWSYLYDTSGRLIEITNPDGTTRAFTWDAADNLTSETDELGRVTSYTHDAYGNVLSQTLPDPDGPGGALVAPVWQWVYGAEGRVVQEIDPAGGVSDFAYDEQGRLITVQRPAAQSGGTRPTWHYTWSAEGLLLIVEDPLGNVTVHGYDDAGRRVSTTLSDPDGPMGPQTSPVWQTVYDEWDRVVQTIDPRGGVTDYAYYAWSTTPFGNEANGGRLHTITLPEPEPGGARPVWTYTWDMTGNLFSQTDPLGRRTDYFRDALDRLVETRLPDPDGDGVGVPRPVYQTVYDALSNVLVQRDPLGNETSFAYDVMSRVTSLTGADPDAGGPLAAPVTTYAWTDAGEEESITDAIGRTTSWLRDGLGRVITTVLPDPDGDPQTPAPEVHTAYDVLSRVISETDALGNVTEYQWDDLSRLVKRIDADPDGAAGPLGNPETLFAWDLVGNILSLTDSVGNTTAWVRDNLYRVIEETNELNASRFFVWDSANNLVSSTDRNGRVTERDFDGLGRLTEERWLDGQTLVNTITFGWDVASQLGVAQDDFSGYAWTFDGMGRTTQTDNSPTPNMPNVVLTSTWDANSRRTGVSAMIDGTADFANTYQFNALGQMTRIEQTDGAPSAGYTVSDKRVDLAYNAIGQFSAIDRYADLAGTLLVASSAYGYDDAGRLTSLDHTKGTNTFAAYSWVYDAHSRITQFVSPDGTSDFSYDDTHQLVGSQNSHRTDEAYAWDENGNPTGSGYVIGTNNRLLSDGTFDYQWDAEGNLTRQTTIATGEYVEFDWDRRNRLTAVTFRDSSSVKQKRVEYTYDLFDRRIGKDVDSNGDGTFDRSERYVYDGEDVVLTFDGSGSLTHRYLHGPGYDQALADEAFATGDLFWLLDDNQGTVRDMAEYDAATDTTSVANHVEYDPFGAILATSDPNVEVFYAYTGQEYDPDTELVYYGGRWYSPTMRRFLSQDPSGFGAGDTNLSRYVFNSPTNFIDPTGRQAQPNAQGPVEAPQPPGPTTYSQKIYSLLELDTIFAGGAPPAATFNMPAPTPVSVGVETPLGTLSFKDPATVDPQDFSGAFFAALAGKLKDWTPKPDELFPPVSMLAKAAADAAKDVFKPKFKANKMPTPLVVGGAVVGTLLYDEYLKEVIPDVKLPIGDKTLLKTPNVSLSFEGVVGHNEKHGYYAGTEIELKMWQIPVKTTFEVYQDKSFGVNLGVDLKY